MKAHQMRRDMGVDREALRFQHGAAEGTGRALAIGAGDMDHGRQLQLRIAQVMQQPQDAV